MSEQDGAERVSMAVDEDRCIGIGQCELLEPDVFHLGDEDAISRVAGGADLSRSRALELVDRCPSGAISIVELGS
ncbi:MAG: ferredoxin [Actinomycetota bacterium]|nr:ferredoxin [Actinomycetota bacterium]MEC9394985.1 ferredoxin [Actinomycetota bacterium]MEC9467361.1 ferredoxin [Actinomycetota bacterium]MED5394838.1 ferredoxin [Actinomycetota bacterium]MED6327994.1 ferredoxin [Actinomycetota bacterium]